jgi:hypothetical protein
MTANPYIPGDQITVEVYRGTLEGVVMQVEDEWVIFDVVAKSLREGSTPVDIGSRQGIHHNQAKKSERVVIRIQADISVDIAEWAEEYGIPHTEVREDVKSYLTTQLSECSPLLRLKGFVS